MAAETFIQYPVDEFSSSDFNIPGEGDYRLASFSIFIPHSHVLGALPLCSCRGNLDPESGRNGGTASKTAGRNAV